MLALPVAARSHGHLQPNVRHGASLTSCQWRRCGATAALGAILLPSSHPSSAGPEPLGPREIQPIGGSDREQASKRSVAQVASDGSGPPQQIQRPSIPSAIPRSTLPIGPSTRREPPSAGPSMPATSVEFASTTTVPTEDAENSATKAKDRNNHVGHNIADLIQDAAETTLLPEVDRQRSADGRATHPDQNPNRQAGRRGCYGCGTGIAFPP